MPDQAITIFRAKPRSRTIGINRDGQPIGVGHLITGGTSHGQWSVTAYCKTVPWSWHLGVFATPELAAAALAVHGETPDHLVRAA